MESKREMIAKRLKEARIQAGLSQEQAAKILKIQRPTISEIEAGRRKVSAEEIIEFSKIYRVESSWLLLEENKDLRSQVLENQQLKEENEGLKELYELKANTNKILIQENQQLKERVKELEEGQKKRMNMYVEFLKSEGIVVEEEHKPQNFEFLYSVWSGENPDGLL